MQSLPNCLLCNYTEISASFDHYSFNSIDMLKAFKLFTADSMSRLTTGTWIPPSNISFSLQWFGWISIDLQYI